MVAYVALSVYLLAALAFNHLPPIWLWKVLCALHTVIFFIGISQLRGGFACTYTGTWFQRFDKPTAKPVDTLSSETDKKG